MIIYGLDKDNDGKPDGVWILQNSYNADLYEEYYITYSSQIFELFGVRKIIDKNWDNCYNISNYGEVKVKGVNIKQDTTLATVIGGSKYNGNYEAISGTVMVTYNKPNYKSEKLKMINFVSASQNSKYKVYVSSDGSEENFQFLKEVNTDLPGLYTVEVNDILLNNEKFSIKIESDNGAMYTTINAFTCDGEIIIESEEITSYADKGYYNENGNYEYHIISNMNNIDDGELFKYTLKDDGGNILLSTVRKSAVVRNGQAIGKIEFTSELEIGKTYYVNIWHDDTLIETLEIIYNPKFPDSTIEGQGTEENPYVITNAYQLSKISSCPKANYILGNDIDLTYNTEVEETFNRGIGWNPIEKFSGKLDGKNYTIKNMYINNYDDSLNEYNEIGLFEQIDGATIQNLNIVNAKILNSYNRGAVYEGILAGRAKNVNINNVMVSGSIEHKNSIGEEYSVGLLIGYLEGNSNTVVQLNNITCQGDIDTKFINKVGGMIGWSQSKVILDNSLIMTNIINNSSNSSIGGIVGEGNVLSVKNSYIIPNMNVKTENVDIIYNSTNKSLTEIKNVVIYENNHATSIEEFKGDSNNNIISSNNIEELKNISLDELEFDTQNWEYINNNPYPTLKGQQIKFIKDIEVPIEITLNKEETKKLNVSIKDEDSTFKKLQYKTNDSSTVEVNQYGEMIGKKENGTAIITVLTCDGSNIAKEVKVTVGEIITPYKINKYDCIEDKKIIDNILPTTIEHYKENIALEAPYTAKIFKGEEEITEGNIATGMITRIYLEDKVVGEYTNVVPGDLDGDGIIRSRDCSMLKQYLIGLRDNMYETPAYYAADFTRDGKVKLNDAEYIQQYVVKMFELKEEEYYGKNN